MVFNPLFLQVVNNQEAPQLSKTQKLTGPSYLFSDIIKVQLDKSETGSMPQGGESQAADNNLLSSIVSALSSQNTSPQMQTAAVSASGLTFELTPASALQLTPLKLPGAADLLDEGIQGGSEASGIEDPNSLLVGNSELINFINSLLTNQQFNGKITIVEPGTEDTLPAKNLNASQVLNLLKDGSTIAVENSAFQSNNGLLIRLFELDGNNAGTGKQENTDPSSTGNIPSVDALSDMLASHSSTQEGAGAQVSEPQYKLNFSLVNNPEAAGTLVDPGKPIIKFPFNSAPVQNQNSLAAALPEGGSISQQTKVSGTSQPAGLQAAGIQPAGTPAAETQAAETQSGEMTQTSSTVDTGTDSAENLTNLNKESLLKEDVLKEIEMKGGKFSKIERVKTGSAVQVKDNTEAGAPKPELSDSAGLKKDSPVSKMLNTESLNAESLNTETLNAEGKKGQKTEESLSKRTAGDQSQASADGSLTAAKEKDFKVSSAKQDDTTSQTAEKAGSADASKSDLNSSSKDSQKEQASTKEQSSTKDQGTSEQSHKSQETIAAGEHSDLKAKAQQDHSFNIGNLSKTNESSFTLKRASDAGIFGEAAKTVKAAEVMKEISRFIQQGDRSSIVLKIDPENLGSVKIALDLADKVVHANIEVENEAARKLMENNLNQLYSSLNQNGLQLNSINISLANQEQKQGKMPNQKRRAFTGESDKDTDEIDGLRQKQMGYNTYDYLI